MRTERGAGEEEEDSGAVLKPRAEARAKFEGLYEFEKKGEHIMSNANIIRIVAGIAFLLVLGLLIQRRRSRVK